ncbi:hypothetical protein DKK68_06200 [Bifidobacterium asteroides]|uniref:hypothetical protein n=1 Tax=Bifidobacterium asteroides TaxID=1684 RepID=UPI000D788D04|nr:hypothetical protein [Bifidobacterium asteroides]PXY87348.1 hypothetical protein DKK68_06200 [Bifidobacterium asteroides]
MNNCSQLLKMNERGIIHDRIVYLSPLVSIMESCYAHEVDKENRDKDYTPEQHQTRRAVNVNMLVHNLWGGVQSRNPWKLVDSRFTHLQDAVTGAYLQLHPTNPLTGKVAKPANTRRSIGRYTQEGCRRAGEIQLWLYQDELAPNLSDVSLQALWHWENEQMVITIYKPLDAQKGSFCIELPLIGDRIHQQAMKFETISENENVLEDLVQQDDEYTDNKNLR